MLGKQQGLLCAGGNARQGRSAEPEVMVVRDIFPIENQVVSKRCISITHKRRVCTPAGMESVCVGSKKQTGSFSLLN